MVIDVAQQERNNNKLYVSVCRYNQSLTRAMHGKIHKNVQEIQIFFFKIHLPLD